MYIKQTEKEQLESELTQIMRLYATEFYGRDTPHPPYFKPKKAARLVLERPDLFPIMYRKGKRGITNTISHMLFKSEYIPNNGIFNENNRVYRFTGSDE